MKHDIIELNKHYNVQGGQLISYTMDLPFDSEVEWSRPALIVVPGGAYWYVSKREWEPIVMEFVARGFNVFALNYMCAPTRYPEQLLELACSVDYVKNHADYYSVDAKRVFAVGFSAGGHLVANLSVNNGAVDKYYDGKLNYKLTASGLSYPVISPEYGHCDSFKNLLADNYDALIDEVTLDKQVNSDTCPSFVWSTFQDDCVPCQNALHYALALKEHNITAELHVYPYGVHGLSACSVEINQPQDCLAKNVQWLDDCADFFHKV